MRPLGCMVLMGIAITGFTHIAAQAPIERRPPPPAALPESPDQIASEREWSKLIHIAADNSGTELRIQAHGEPFRCRVEEVTPDEIFCSQHRPSPWQRPAMEYRIPRAEVREVRQHGRAYSTLLGVCIGVGTLGGMKAVTTSTDSATNGAIGVLLGGVIGGFLGHALPFKGNVVYRTR